MVHLSDIDSHIMIQLHLSWVLIIILSTVHVLLSDFVFDCEQVTININDERDFTLFVSLFMLGSLVRGYLPLDLLVTFVLCGSEVSTLIFSLTWTHWVTYCDLFKIIILF